MLLSAVSMGLAEQGLLLAALLQERDVLRPADGTLSADLWLRMEACSGKVPPGCTLDESVLQRVRQEVRALRPEVAEDSSRAASGDEQSCGLLAAIAYPDRIAQRRSSGTYLLSSGRGAVLPRLESMSAAPYLVAVHLDDQGAESRILIAAELAERDLMQRFQEHMKSHTILVWLEEQQSVKATEQQRLSALIIRERPLAGADPIQVAEVLAAAVQRQGLDMLPWSRAHRQLRERMQFMHCHEPEWPDVSEQSLRDSVEHWLLPHLYGMRSKADLQRLSLSGILEAMLSWRQRTELQEQAPTHIRVPSGSSIPIDYQDPDAPALAVRLQETFGWLQTPRLCHGKIPLTLHLLSPAGRPVQVTRDLASFWREAYFEVKKDLKGRYPKHYWPDEPLTAKATNRVKPRG